MTMLLPLGAIVFFQVADYWSFLILVNQYGLAAEANPIVAAVGHELGIVGLTAVKLGGVVIAISALMMLTRRHPKMAMTVFAAAVGSGMVGAISNLSSL